jgi:hypothetical protein
LADADIGWHIRTGELILATHSLPRTDPFSSTMQGQPWFAWEWLYDLSLGILDRACGLNGVVWLGALLIAATFALLLWELVQRGTGLLLAIVLMLLAEAASTIHFYARPHTVSWLFTLLWFIALDKAEQRSHSDRRQLPRWLPWFLPISMLLWVNLHGGWLFGLALLGIYTLAAWIESWRATDPFAAVRESQRASSLTLAWGLSAVATLANPFCWKLHAHIYRYLSDRYLMNRIDEFRSPDFHGLAERCFAIILVVVLIAFAGTNLRENRSWLGLRLNLSNLLIAVFAICAGLYSSRNLPVSSILLVLVAGPVLRKNIAALADKPAAWRWLRNIVAQISNFSDRMTAQETQYRGHLWPLVISSFALAICLQGGWLGSRRLVPSEFDPEKMPVAAVRFLQDEARSEEHLKQPQPPIFSTDAWGGYLIYRMYPEQKVVVDDRHDLYGSDRVRQYLTLTQGEAGWQKVLKDWNIQAALLPADATLANLLRELPQEWREEYGDKVAVVFLKHGKPEAANRSLRGR